MIDEVSEYKMNKVVGTLVISKYDMDSQMFLSSHGIHQMLSKYNFLKNTLRGE
jgi:hypothetical protein